MAVLVWVALVLNLPPPSTGRALFTFESAPSTGSSSALLQPGSALVRATGVMLSPLRRASRSGDVRAGRCPGVMVGALNGRPAQSIWKRR
jgi:hypothetical protein